MLSSSALQWIALITMTIDHIGFLLFPKLTILRVIGRIAMPIFVFCLAEGFIHTKSRQKYFMRLGILAVISEALAVVAYLFNFEYGAPAVLLAVAFYFICNLRDFRVTYVVTLTIALGLFAFATTYNAHWWIQAYSTMAVIPLALYSGKKGKRIPYRLNYWYYPAHILLLLMLRIMHSHNATFAEARCY